MPGYISFKSLFPQINIILPLSRDCMASLWRTSGHSAKPGSSAIDFIYLQLQSKTYSL